MTPRGGRSTPHSPTRIPTWLRRWPRRSSWQPSARPPVGCSAATAKSKTRARSCVGGYARALRSPDGSDSHCRRVIRYDEYDEDIAENQLLLAATLMLLESAVVPPRLQMRLARLRRALADITSPNPGAEPSPAIEPDLTWYDIDGKPVAVIDAKYKTTAVGTRGQNADMYQPTAYCTALGLREGHLIYAKDDAASHCSMQEVGVRTRQHTPVDRIFRARLTPPSSPECHRGSGPLTLVCRARGPSSRQAPEQGSAPCSTRSSHRCAPRQL